MIAYFLGVFLGLLFLPVLLSTIPALPGLLFKGFRRVFKIISLPFGWPQFFSLAFLSTSSDAIQPSLIS